MERDGRRVTIRVRGIETKTFKYNNGVDVKLLFLLKNEYFDPSTTFFRKK